MPARRTVGALVALLLFGGAGTAKAETPDAFLRGLYARYPLQGGRASPVLDRPSAWLADPLLALVRRERAISAKSGEIAVLDFDPVCGCQDDSGLADVAVAVERSDASSALAQVRFRIGQSETRVTYQLAATKAGWRIADIATADVPSLRAHLVRYMPKQGLPKSGLPE